MFEVKASETFDTITGESLGFQPMIYLDGNLHSYAFGKFAKDIHFPTPEEAMTAYNNADAEEERNALEWDCLYSSCTCINYGRTHNA